MFVFNHNFSNPKSKIMKSKLSFCNCYKKETYFIAMVAFARAKANSIFSKLRLTTTAKTKVETIETSLNEELTIKKERHSNFFLEAIKSGGIWLS